MCAGAALVVAAALAGCGGTTYFAGRNLPPSGLTNRVMIAVQNPSAFAKGSLRFVDAYYDVRSGYSGKPAGYSISGYSRRAAGDDSEHAGGAGWRMFTGRAMAA